MEKRMEELKHATAKLKALAEAMVVVHGDSTAREILERVLTEGTFDGTPTHVEDLHNSLLIAYGHGSAGIAAEAYRLADESAAKKAVAA